MRFTIIIPIYNAAMYLAQCLDSVRVQSFRDFEVIMVDDGSVDESANICRHYCADDNRFRLVSHERNKGASAARNTGIDCASGEYLLFLDNDDWWDSGVALENVNRALVIWDNPDILCYPLGEFYDGDAKPHMATWNLDGNFAPEAGYRMLVQTLLKQGLYYSSASGKAIKRSLINQSALRFDEGLRHNEDSEWSRRLLLHANSIGWLETSFYVYRRNSAVSQSKNPNYRHVLSAMLVIVERQIRDLNSCQFDEAHSDVSSAFVSYIYVLALSYVGLLGKSVDFRSVEVLKRNRWLLKYSVQRRVTLVRWCMSIAGFKVTTTLLGRVMNREQRRVAASS